MADYQRIKERERAHLAKQVSDNPVYQDAWTSVIQRLREHMEAPGSSDEAVLAARDAIRITKEVRRYIERVMETGKLAEIELERSKDGTDKSGRAR